MIQSLLGSTVSGQTQEAEEREQRRRKGTEGGQRGEEQVLSVRLGVSRHRETGGEERRRLRSGGRTGSVSVIDIPSCLE